MPRAKNPPERRTVKGHKPRRGEGVSTVNLRHERFAHEYLVDFEAGAAYLRAGYEAKDEETAQSAGRRLLRNIRVWEIIHAEHLKRIEACKLDAEKVILSFQLVYTEAYRDKDWGNAIAALREIGKHYGIYEKHQQGKVKYTEADIPLLKAKLEAAGFNYGRKSYEEAQTPSTN